MWSKSQRWGMTALGIGIGLVAARGLLRRARYFDFTGKRVLVTGGSRGLGLCIARRLVDEGAQVAICARTKSQLETATKELQERGGDVLHYACDVGDPKGVERMVRQIKGEWGGLDVVFNVAGIIEVGPIEAMSLADFHRSMDTNCWGALHTTLAVLPGMRRQGWGRIVNVSSFGGKRAVPHMIPYAASKFALVGLSNGLRTELLKEGILVSTICPGLMRTGSPRNATFKGQHRKEYAWFSIGDSLPLVSMSSDRAARLIVRACQRGDAEVTIGGGGSLSALAQAAAPNLVSEALAIMARLLPEMGGIGRRAARGSESQSSWSPSWLTRLGDRAAIRNNELHLDN